MSWTIVLWGASGMAYAGILGQVTRRLLRGATFHACDYLISATLTGVLFALLAWRLEADFILLPYSYLAGVLVVHSMVDAKEHRLPSAVTLPSCGVLIAAFTAHGALTSSFPNLLRALAGMLILTAGYLTLALTTGGLGAGDVKLAGLLGLALGWWGWPVLITGTLLGWLSAALGRLFLRTTKRANRADPMPLGPALAFGSMVAVLAGAGG